MSCFLGASAGFGLLQISDERHALVYHQWGRCVLRLQQPFLDGVLWPNSRGMGGQFGCITEDAISVSGSFELLPGFDESGGRQMKKLIGMTLDSNGDPLGNCLVQGFLTSNDTYIGQTISDTGGYYELPTAYSGAAHYIVAYKSGSPDVAGTSVNTLVPA